jgi:cell division protease FtsH
LLLRRDATPAPTLVPISDLLNLADQHQLDHVTIASNTLIATSKQGQQFRAIKEDQQTVTEQLRADDVAVSVVDATSQGFGPGALAALVPLLAILGLIWLMSRRSGINNQAMSFGRSGARRYSGNSRPITFDDVAGVEEAKQELAEIVQFFKFPEKFQAIGARVPKGVLLVGPPGTGKTLISRALAGEAVGPS